MPLLEKRVVGEVSNCLIAYGAANLNRYPWAAALNPGAPPAYDDDSVSDDRFGRVPDGFPNSGVVWDTTTLTPTEQFTATNADSGTLMAKSWPLSQCSIISTKSKNTWWLNWKEEVFYAVADAFKPGNATAPPPSDASACPTPFSCLTLASTATANNRFLVVASGRRLAGQDLTVGSNANKGTPSNYLEGENATFTPGGDETFTSGPATATFDDVVGFE
ncbi:MAG: hypothetical protein ACT4QB_14925 [Gammaproteobacteria bacterium]